MLFVQGNNQAYGQDLLLSVQLSMNQHIQVPFLGVYTGVYIFRI